jgi:nicotinamide phosphoribosyltransferase
LPGVDHVVFFGLQYFLLRYLIHDFGMNFFGRRKEEVVGIYKRRLDHALGPDAVPMDHIEALHDLGYLPLEIKALPEGSVVPLRVPFLTIENTLPEYFWLTNFIETMLSNALWHPITVATIAFEYRKLLTNYAQETSDNPGFVDWQGHDFSMRGQTSIESSAVAGAAHLLSFKGTDTIPAIDFLESYYQAVASAEMIGGSVPATEHSVMCFGGETSEYETFHRLITEVYPKGIVSVVSDTWDYWKIITETLPKLKDVVMAREGKVVVRPDSGDPVRIICGDPSASWNSPEYKGTVELLWETFGGTVNSKGYKELDPHIGVIYGDSITLDRANDICSRLRDKGFASTNIVFGIGSFTYQYVTRDTFGMAIKATAGYVNGQELHVFKNPKTDTGMKKSAKGYLVVQKGADGHLVMVDQLSKKDVQDVGLLRTVFLNGVAFGVHSLADIRKRLMKNL